MRLLNRAELRVLTVLSSACFCLLLLPPSLGQDRPKPLPEVQALLDKGKAEVQQNHPDEAARLYAQALRLAQDRKDRPGEAEALLGSGRAIIYQSPLKSIETIMQATTIFRELKDRRGEAISLMILGGAYQMSAQPQKAIEVFQASGQILRELRLRPPYANVLNNMSTVYIRTGQPYRAIDLLQEALPIYEAEGDKHGVLVVFGNLGAAYNNARNIPKAMETLEKARALSHELGKKQDEGIILLNLGLAHVRMTGPRKALELYEKALPLLDDEHDTRSTGAVYSSMAEAYSLLGDLFKALEYSYRALDVHRQVSDGNGVSRDLLGLAAIYERVGQVQTAMEQYQAALQESRKAGDVYASMTILNEMGSLHGKLGQPRQELDCYSQSLALHQDDNYKDARADTLLRLARSLYNAGRYAEAYRRCREAHGLYRQASSSVGEGNADLRMGEILQIQGQSSQARDHFERALKLFQEIGDVVGEAAAAAALATVEEGEGRPDQAEQRYIHALALLENSRASLGGLAEAKAGFLEQQMPVYQGYVRFLLQAGKEATSFEATQKAKARALIDLMGAANANVTQAMTAEDKQTEERMATRSRLLAQQWLAATGNLEDLKRQAQPDKNRQEHVKAEADRVRREQQQLERDWRTFQDRLYARNPQLARQRAARLATLEETVACLPADTALLEYVVLPGDPKRSKQEEVVLFVVTKQTARSRLQVFRTKVAAGSLVRMVTELREACAGRPGSAAARPYHAPSRALYRLLVAPAERVLAGKRRLVVCPGGPLWDVPFQALLAPSAASAVTRKAGVTPQAAFLLERYGIAYSYSATGMKAALDARDRSNRPRAQRSMLVMADPALDPATTGAARSPAASQTRKPDARDDLYFRGGGLGALPYTRMEANAIARSFPDVTLKLKQEAQEAFVKQSAQSYRNLHFATHAAVNDAAPMLSGIILARPPKESKEDGILTAREILPLSLSADLVVLSACDTGRGARKTGEGIVGLTWALFVAGAPAQVVSQWAVDDAATAQLMGGFYRGLKVRKSKEEALRHSALSLMRDGKHAHPFYWAPFVLMGDWR
jgi:CHAT domain-containing protein/tetratricopeptide (TPR) repeat protein